METTDYRRGKQIAYNKENNITPVSVTRALEDSLHAPGKSPEDNNDTNKAVCSDTSGSDVASVIADMEEEMLEAARQLQFEKAAMIRDQIETLQNGQYGGGSFGAAKKKPMKKRKSKAIYNAKGLPRRRK